MRFAVAHTDLFDHELKIEIHEGSYWREALLKHSAFDSDAMQNYLKDMPAVLEDAKDFFFDGDGLIDVIEIDEMIAYAGAE